MKKILAILLVGIFVVSIPAVASLNIPKICSKQIIDKPISKTADVPDWADGNITGIYAMKNETGEYEILGNIFAYYHQFWGNSTGYYVGIWESLDGNQSGQFSGWFFYHIILGYYNITGSNDTGGFIGLMKVNESDMTIKSVTMVTGNDDYFIRYASCTYTKFE
jgi:hypothetical protein